MIIGKRVLLIGVKKVIVYEGFLESILYLKSGSETSTLTIANIIRN